MMEVVEVEVIALEEASAVDVETINNPVVEEAVDVVEDVVVDIIMEVIGVEATTEIMEDTE